MKFLSKTFFICFFLVACLVSSTTFAQQLVPKVKNFIVLQDTSGSMEKAYQDFGKAKVEVSKETLARMNQAIPNLDYQGALFRVAPYTQVHDLAPYNKNAFANAIEAIPGKVSWAGFGYPSPLGDHLKEISAVLDTVDGPTAIIFASDGAVNKGVDPVEVAQALYQKYDVCFHIISLADTTKGQKVLDEIAALNSCSASMTAADLTNPANLDSFVEKVFYTTATPQIQEPIVIPVDEEPVVVPPVMRVTVLFDTDKTVIKPEFEPLLAEFGEFLVNNPETIAEIVGHTDSVGTASYNLNLSERRALSVINYLMRRYDLPQDRFTMQAMGKSSPIATNKTAAGRAQNRRVVCDYNK